MAKMKKQILEIVTSPIADYKNYNLVKNEIKDFDELYESFCKPTAEAYKCILENRYRHEGFVNRLLFSYHDAFTAADIFLEKCLGIARGLYEKKKKNDLEEVLCRLHSRAVLRTNEILTLLKNGFPDGAFASWRSLFETTIVALIIIQEYEQDPKIAERYIKYIAVNQKKQAEVYNEHLDVWMYEKIDDDRISELKKEVEDLKNKYGKNFDKEYGWFRPAEQRTYKLDEISKLVRNECMKPYYKLSSSEIHPVPSSLYHKLGLLHGTYNENYLMNGSNIGFVDPAQLTILNLWQVTGILSSMLSSDHFIDIFFLREEVINIAKLFHEAEQKILKEDLKSNANKKRKK